MCSTGVVKGTIISGSSCVESVVIRLTTGAAAGCILTSNTQGCGIWCTPASSGIAWSGSTVNGVGTYVSASKICSNPNMSFDGTKLGITGNICASTCLCSPITIGTSCVCSPTILGSTCVCGGIVCATTIVTAACTIGTTCVCGTVFLASTSSCSPIHCGACGYFSTIVCSPTITGSTKICSPIVIGTTCVCSPIVCAGTCFVGSGAGLTGTASSLTVGTATNANALCGCVPSCFLGAGATAVCATTAGNALCLGGALANTYAPLAAPVFTGLLTTHGGIVYDTPTLGCSCGDFIIGSNNCLYGLAVGVAGNGNTIFQSQRFDTSTATYNIVFQPCGGNVGIGTIPFAKLTMPTAAGDLGDIAWDCAPNVASCRWWMGPDKLAYGDFSILTESVKGSASPNLTRLNITPTGVVCACISIASPIVCASTCFVGSGAGLIGTAGSLTVGCASTASIAGCANILNVTSNNEVTLGNGFTGGVLYIAYRGSSGAGITSYIMTNGLAGGALACVCAIDFIATSDVRLKTCINPICNALSTVLCLQGINYQLCCDEKHENHIGLIAQDVLKVLPEVVTLGTPDDKDTQFGITDGRMGIKYEKLTAVLIEAFKEQQKHIEKQDKEIICLRNDLNNYNKNNNI